MITLTVFRFLFLFFALWMLPCYGLAQQSVVLVGSGSTVPVPLYRRWSEEFNKRSPDVQMQYVPLGTSEGIKQISHGINDFGAGEVPLTLNERSEGGLIELPVMLIGIVPIYNLPQVHQDLRFSGELLADIFLGRVKTWNAPEIARMNPGVALPDLSIRVIYRSGGKGSNYVFTDFLSKNSARFRGQVGTTASPAWPVGVAADRSSDMADAVKNTPGSIGYVELQYAQHDNIQYGLVLNPSGRFVKASPATITVACQAVEAPRWEKFSASLTNAPGSDSFPISSFTWVYLRTKPSDPRRAAALLRLLNWIFTDGQPLGAQLGYSELPKTILENVRIRANSLSQAGAKGSSKVQNQSDLVTGRTSQARRPANAAMKQQFSFL
jgi:phosphate transport system substrate-binding protein